MECDFAVALPYQFRLQDDTGIVEDLQGQHLRTLGTIREDFKLLKHQLEYIPSSGCFDYS
jgi:hypothetical protein